MKFTLRARHARISGFLVTAAVALTALFAPVPASAEPGSAELATVTDKATADLAAANAGLQAIDTEIASTRVRLAAVESRLPSNPRQQAKVVATAMGSMFSPALMDRSEGLAADERARVQLKDKLVRLGKERAKREREVAQARLRRNQAAALLAEANRAEAEQARAAEVAALGVFPVAGPTEFIDSWGFARPGGRAHKGTDIFAAKGTPVVAVHDGVATAGSNGLGGLTVWIAGDDGKRYYYAHLDTIVVGSGRVVAGQVLGTVGNTGDARGTSPHLHFEIHQPGAVDPYQQLLQMVR